MPSIPANQKQCTGKDCQRKQIAKGYCPTHYSKYYYPSIEKDKTRVIQKRDGFPQDYPYEYKIWFNIKQRIFNPKNKAYKNYGGRGLTMQPEWVDDFKCFIKDVGAKTEQHLTLDRIDNNKGYIKGNVRWVDWFTQARNRRPRLNKGTGCQGIEKTKSNTYMVRIRFDGKRKYLGTYKTLKQARVVRKEAELSYWYNNNRN